MHNRSVSFDWDPDKATANFSKHTVRFSEALGVFSDEWAITIKDDSSDLNEARFATLGMGLKGRVLAVVFCYRAEDVGIISARTADRTEREQYEERR